MLGIKLHWKYKYVIKMGYELYGIYANYSKNINTTEA